MTIGILPRKGHVRYFRGQVGSLRGEQVDDADDDKTSEQTPPSDLGTLKPRSLVHVASRQPILEWSLVAVSLCGRSHTLAWRRRTNRRSGRRRAPPYLVAVRIQRPIAAAATARALPSVRPRRSFPPNSLHPIRLLQSSLIRTIVEMLQQSVVGILILAAAVAAQAPPGRCPEDYGVQTYPHEAACDRFYKVRREQVA